MPIKNSIENLSTAVKEKYIENLSKYTKIQLIEMRDRQLKLLSNKSRLMKLPDKGERIQKLYDNIMQQINARNDIERAAELFSELNIVEKGVKTVTDMEWNNGKVSGGQVLVAADTLDSDDNDDVDGELDPLKIIAQSHQTKLVKVVKPPKSLITEADLEDIKLFHTENETNRSENGSVNTSTKSNENVANKSSNSIELDPHAINMIKKDRAFDKDAIIKQKFLPFRTTKSDVHNVEKEKQRTHGKHWEITAATPPNLRNNAVRLISLQDSIEMEKQQQEHVQEQMKKQAEERLAARKKIISDNISLLPSGSGLIDPNSFFQSYRQRNAHFDEISDSDDEPHSDNSDADDEEEEPDTHGISVIINE